MIEITAIKTADALVSHIIQYQLNLFGSSALSSLGQAKEVAQTVAALRSELIEQLIQQK